MVLSDEGDDSRRIPGQSTSIDAYQELFAQFGVPMQWVVIGPALDVDGNPSCPGPSTSWGAQRFAQLVELSGGGYVPITGPDCDPADAESFVAGILSVVGP